MAPSRAESSESLNQEDAMFMRKYLCALSMPGHQPKVKAAVAGGKAGGGKAAGGKRPAGKGKEDSRTVKARK